MGKKYIIDEDSIITRRAAEGFVEQARKNRCSAIDFSNVESISRSVADEFVHRTKDSNLSLTGLSGDVQTVINIVRNSKKPVV